PPRAIDHRRIHDRAPGGGASRRHPVSFGRLGAILIVLVCGLPFARTTAATSWMSPRHSLTDDQRLERSVSMEDAICVGTLLGVQEVGGTHLYQFLEVRPERMVARRDPGAGSHHKLDRRRARNVRLAERGQQSRPATVSLLSITRSRVP